MTVAWPAAYSALKPLVEAEWGVAGDGGVQLLQQFDDGKSGASVYRVDIRSAAHQGLAILKLDRVRDHTPLDREKDRYEDAHRDAPAYARDRFPRVLASYEQDGQTALLSSYAGDSFTEVQPLNRVDSADDQRRFVRRFVRGVLGEWNADYTSGPAEHPTAVLQRWLGYRLWDDQGGRLPGYCDPTGLSAPGLRCGDRFLPNPYVYAVQPALWPRVELLPVVGRQHGDLHDKNILVRRLPPGSDDYFLIDLALYAGPQPLFYDPAYLELSLLLRAREGVPAERWLKLLDSVGGDLGGRPHALEDEGLVTLARAVREEEEGWARTHEAGRADYVAGQRLLARVAVGLNYANKPASDSIRQLGMLFAAHHLATYLDRFGVPWAKAGPAWPGEQPAAGPAAAATWASVWDACDRFDARKNLYLLVAGPGLGDRPAAAVDLIGGVRWAAVLDFDPDGRVVAAVKRSPSRVRLIHEIHADQAEHGRVSTDYRDAIAWLRANGVRDRPGTIPADDRDWRRKYKDAIEALTRDLHLSFGGRPVVVLVVGQGMSPYQCERVHEYLEDKLGEQTEFVVTHDGAGAAAPAVPNARSVRCRVDDLLAGVRETFGSVNPLQVLVPRRTSHSKEGTAPDQREMIPLSPEDDQYLREDLEVVHAGLADAPADGEADGSQVPAFLRGYTVTWKELDAGLDAARDVVRDTPAAKGLVTKLRDALTFSRHYTLTLYHDPGAGGTTVARRVAWELMHQFPTVMVKRLSDATPARIRRLFQVTDLPVLVVMEASAVSPELREKLYRDLRQSNTRAAFLYVQRNRGWSDPEAAPEQPAGAGKAERFEIPSPMRQAEAKSFRARYDRWCPADRRKLLDDLVEDKDWAVYRSPFFFGLVTFGDKFTRVADYVRGHLDGVTDDAALAVRFLALVTRYSQVGVPESVVKTWLKVPAKKRLDLNATARCGLNNLVMYSEDAGDGRARVPYPVLRVVHPVLADTVLDQALPWAPGLADLCCQFIEAIVSATEATNKDTRELLKLMFIDRGPWRDEPGSRGHFSELIGRLDDEGTGGTLSQHRVLTRLTELCPLDAHFWNHRGRHIMYVMQKNHGMKYQDAEACLLRAIELEPKNHVHYHALGMVYRIEVRRLFEELRHRARAHDRGRPRGGAPAAAVTPDDGHGAIRDLFERAGQAFQKARDLDPTDGYSYVTQIQMTAFAIIDLKALSEADSFHEFLRQDNPVARWCAQRLSEAEELLRQLKGLEPQSADVHSQRANDCENQLTTLYDQNAGEMITALQQALSKRNTNRAPLRRMIANSYLRTRAGGRAREWGELSEGDLRSIAHQMQKLFDEGDVTPRDYWLWFQTVRRLKAEFNLLEVLDRLGRWAASGGSYEAHYYLYVLHFLRCAQGLDVDGRSARDHLAQCQKLTEARRIRRADDYPELLAPAPPWCPIIGVRELGPWKPYEAYENEMFVTYLDRLQRLEGTVLPGFKSQSAHIEFHAAQDVESRRFSGPTFRAFFVPGQRFLPGKDENARVRFYLGFSYDGFRARLVERAGS